MTFQKKSFFAATNTGTMPDAATGYGLLEGVSTFSLVENLQVGGWPAGGTVRGSIKNGDAAVLINARYSFARDYGFDQIRAARNWYIGTAIHELIHLAGNGVFSDGQLAKAAYELGASSIAVPDPDTNDMNRIMKHSGTWQDALAKFCGAR